MDENTRLILDEFIVLLESLDMIEFGDYVCKVFKSYETILKSNVRKKTSNPKHGVGCGMMILMQ